MGYIASSSTITFKAYLTQKGRELYFNGNDEDILTNYFSLGDSDCNYFISPNNENTLKSGFVPNITGVEDMCINTVANGVNIKHLIKMGKFPKGTVVNQYCQIPNTLVEEISNGDGTTYFRETPNSVTCGFYYNSNIFTRTFTKNSCSGNSIGQNYVVSTTYGQFTGTTQDMADSKALTYLMNNGQQIANDNGSCMFVNDTQIMSFTKNDCTNGGNIYVVSANTGTFSSLISKQDADSKALTYLMNNGQQIANDNGTCKTVIGTTKILLYNPSDIQINRNNDSNIGIQLKDNNTLVGAASNIFQPFPPFGIPYTIYIRLLPNNTNNKKLLVTLFGSKPKFGGVTENLDVIGKITNNFNIIPITNYTETITSNPPINGLVRYELNIIIDNYQNNQIIGVHFSNTLLPNVKYNYSMEVYEIVNIYQ